MRSRSACLAAAASLVGTACQSPSSGSATAPAASLAPSASSSTAAPSAAAPSSRPTASQAAPGAPDKGAREATGAVTLLQSRVPSPRSELVSYFFDVTTDNAAQRSPCSGQAPPLGTCSVCVVPPLASGAHTTRPAPGPITVSIGQQQLQLLPGNVGVTAPSLHGGETVRFEAGGNPKGVPAFSGQVVAPVFVRLTPASTLRDQAKLDAGSSVDVAWSPSSPDGVVHVELVAVRAAGPTLPADKTTQTHVVCEFDGKSGKGTIPADAMGRLSAGILGVTIEAVSTTTVHAGPFVIELGVSDSVVSGTAQLTGK